MCMRSYAVRVIKRMMMIMFMGMNMFVGVICMISNRAG